jgi:hypothetical protein|tara:strand:- start:272 stop:529 length:258 start_codon:yes stop_codon:yes gene_type:complete
MTFNLKYSLNEDLALHIDQKLLDKKISLLMKLLDKDEWTKALSIAEELDVRFNLSGEITTKIDEHITWLQSINTNKEKNNEKQNK